MWSQSHIEEASNGMILSKDDRSFCKNGHELVLWDTNESHNGMASTNTINLLENLFNKKD